MATDFPSTDSEESGTAELLRTADASAVPGRARLIVTAGPAEMIGQSYNLDAETVLGRVGQIAIDDHGVSRLHAKIVRDTVGHYTVTDLGSRNGTFVNGARVTNTVLKENDRIQIGAGTILRFSTQSGLDPEEQLRRALAAARVGTWEWSVAQGAVRFADRVDEVLGLAAGTLAARGTDLVAMSDAEDRPRLHDALNRCLREGGPLEIELRLDIGPKLVRWVALKGELLRAAGGGPDRITGTIQDVTARKQGEQELRRQAAMFESLYDGVVLCDSQGRIVDWNASAERLFGYSKPEVLGKPLFAVTRPDSSEKTTAEVMEQLGRDGRWTGETELKTKTGGTFFCEAVMVPLKSADGLVKGTISIHRDVTERKQLQSKLMFADRLAAVGTLAAGVAHEINNPLAFIFANLDFLSEQLAEAGTIDNVEQRAELQKVIAECNSGVTRIAKIVSDLKTFTHHSVSDTTTSVEVRPVVELALKMADNVLRHRAKVSTDFQAVPKVRGDEFRLGQVFLNLLINAAQAIPEGKYAESEVRLGIRPGEEGTAVIEVADTGMGMSPEVRAQIFDPFFTTKDPGQGTGLGLSTCLGIVRSVGGDISVESAEGQGTRVRVVLPTVAASEVAASPVAERPRPPGPRRRVLVIDDEPLLGASLQRLLSNRHDVFSVTSAREALRLFDQGLRFDLILCDLMMPEMSGTDFHQELSRRIPEQALHIAFMTGGTFGQRVDDFLKNVPNFKLSKPLNIALLQEILERGPENAAAVVPAAG